MPNKLMRKAMTDNDSGIKKRQVFDDVPVDKETRLREAKRFDPQEAFIKDSHDSVHCQLEEKTDQTIEESLSEDSDLFVDKQPIAGKRSWSLLAKLIFTGLIALLLVETGLGLRNAWLESPWIFALYSAVTLLISFWAGKVAYGEWQQLRRLKSVEEAQQVGDRLSQSMQIGEADKFLGKIISHLPNEVDCTAYFDSSREGQNDAEKLILFDDLVLSDRDRVAKKIVRRFAQESALLLAASPLAVLDMAIILWRNQRMIVKIADCYGIELGYWSRVKLIKGVITNIIYAGTSEIATDLGTQLLSVEMSGKLSARLAQGLGGGLLTARLGYQAMALCRPISFKASSRPKLSGVHRELLLDLKAFSSAVFQKEDKDKVPSRKSK